MISLFADYRTLRHKASHIIFMENEDSEIDGAVFSSLGATLKFLKLFPTREATIQDRGGNLVGEMKNGGITLFL